MGHEEGHFVYKYVSDDGRVVYVGRSSNLTRRIKEHGRCSGVDAKFKRYKSAKVFIHECSTMDEQWALELLLIEAYKPILNVFNKTELPLSIKFNPDEIGWDEFKLKPSGVKIHDHRR